MAPAQFFSVHQSFDDQNGTPNVKARRTQEPSFGNAVITAAQVSHGVAEQAKWSEVAKSEIVQNVLVDDLWILWIYFYGYIFGSNDCSMLFYLGGK